MKFPYFELLKKSWQICWKHKILWVFGLFVPASYSLPVFSFDYSFPNFREFGGSKYFFKNQPLTNFLKDADKVLKFSKTHLFWIIFFVVIFFALILIFQILSWLSKPALIKLVELKETQDKNPSLIEGFQWGQKYFFRYVLAGWSLWIPYLMLISIPGIGIILSLLMLLKNTPLSLTFFFLFLLSLLFLAFLSIPFSLITELVHRKVVIDEKRVFEAIKEGLKLFLKEWQKIILVWLISTVISFVFGLALLIAFIPLFFFLLGSTFFSIILNAKGVAHLVFILATSVFIFLFVLVSLFVKAISGTLLTNYWTLTYIEIQKANQTLPQPSLPLEPKT